MKKILALLPSLLLASLGFTGFVTAGTIAPKSGASLCAALTPTDFQAAGVAGTSNPKPNVDDPASAYCTYSGKSSATGGVELDVFYPAGANPAEVKATQVTAIGELSSTLKPIPVPGAEEAQWAPHAVSGGPAFATIVVRRGSLVFVLGIPSGKDSQAQLLKLSQIALSRL